jgi:hypothetical protein
MVKALQYFFYRLYSGSLSSGQNDPGWSMMIVSILVGANFYSTVDLILIIFKQRLPQVGNIIIIIIGCSLLYFIYHILLRNGKAKIILKEYENENPSKRKMRTLLIWLYVIGSISLFILTGNIVKSMN